VLPESVALQYGEGGGQATAAEASLVRLNDEARITLLASYKENASLRDSDRGIDVPSSAYYTLLPGKTDTKVAATVSRSRAPALDATRIVDRRCARLARRDECIRPEANRA